MWSVRNRGGTLQGGVPSDPRQRSARAWSRRTVVRGAARGGAGIVAATVLGCGEREELSPGTRAVTKQPKRGGMLNLTTVTSGVFQAGLDPHVIQHREAGLQRLFYQGLLRPQLRTQEAEPELAQKWESPSPTEFIFTLMPGVKWHDKPPANGRELTADDVVFSLNRTRTNEPRFILRANYYTVEKVEALNRSTVKLTLNTPDVSILDTLAASSSVILAPEVVESAAGKFETADKVVGTGPFILQAKDDRAAVVVRNPHYYKPGLPYLDGIRLHFFAERQTMWAAFVAGRLDMNYAPGELARKYKEERGRFVIEQRYDAEWFADPGMHGLYQNVQRPPFNDPRVDKALKLLMDHDEQITANIELSDGRGRLISVLPSALESWDFSEEEYRTKFLAYKRPKDEAVKVALDLLRAAGFTRDNPLKFSQVAIQSGGGDLNAWSVLAEAQFRRLGQGVVQPELKPLDQATVNSVLNRGDFEVSTSGMPSPIVEPGAYIRGVYYTNAGRNYGRWSDPRVDQMLDRAQALYDLAQRKALIKDLVAYLVENAPYTGLGGRYPLSTAHPKVQDWAPEGPSWAMSYQFESVWLDT